MKILFRLREVSKKSILLDIKTNNNCSSKIYFYVLPTSLNIYKHKGKNLLKLFEIKFEWLFWYFKIEYKKYKK
jgi:hypothetical protein